MKIFLAYPHKTRTQWNRACIFIFQSSNNEQRKYQRSKISHSFINVEPTPQGWTNQFRSQFVNCLIDLTLNRSNIYVFMPKIDAWIYSSHDLSDKLRCKRSSHYIILRSCLLLKKSSTAWLFSKVSKSCNCKLQDLSIIVIYQFSSFSFFENNVFPINRSNCLIHC